MIYFGHVHLHASNLYPLSSKFGTHKTVTTTHTTVTTAAPPTHKTVTTSKGFGVSYPAVNVSNGA